VAVSGRSSQISSSGKIEPKLKLASVLTSTALHRRTQNEKKQNH